MRRLAASVNRRCREYHLKNMTAMDMNSWKSREKRKRVGLQVQASKQRGGRKG